MDIQIINTCYETTQELRTVASYSHLVPVVLSLLLAILVLFKAKFNLFSKIFLSFVFAFSAWLVGDLILWTSNNYYLVYSVWSTLLYLEMIFFMLGLYFVLVFIYKKDISVKLKVIFFLTTFVPFIMTLLGQSVLSFDQSVCEALNNSFLDLYKLVFEIIIIFIILAHLVKAFFIKQDYKFKKASLIVLGSLLVFLSIFGSTEYIASMTGIYEINLYSLFILPIFLSAIIYAVFELDIFHFHILGTHYLVIGLVVLMCGQLFFIDNKTDELLTIFAIVMGVILSVILFRNLKKESDQRVKIENLSVQLEKSKLRLEETNLKLEQSNDKLKELDKLKTEFLSLASHQIRSPLTAINGYASMVLDGSFGDVNVKAKEAVDKIFQSSNHLTLLVEDFLNVSKIESGGMKYEMEVFNLPEMVSDMAKELSITAEKKGLKLIYNEDNEKVAKINGDKNKLRQVILNFIDNSMKYTKEGQINVILKKNGNKVTVGIKDTGVGIPLEIQPELFKKFSRGEGAKMNTGGSGLGLYLAKAIVEAHKGIVKIESEGAGKGSTFSIELDTVE